MKVYVAPSLQFENFGFGGRLGLAETELIFFLGAQRVLCFGSVIGAVLVTHQNLAAAEQSLQRNKAFSFPCSPASVSRLGECKKLEETKPGQLT